MWEQEQIQVEWLLLADAAQIVGGKLYVIGGGWTILSVNGGFPVEQRCSIVAAFSIPWNETNVPHDWRITVQDEDRKPLLELGGELLTGRPAGLPAGHPQRTQLAVDVALRFERPGTYSLVATIDGRDAHRTPFLIAAGPGLAIRQRQSGGEP